MDIVKELKSRQAKIQKLWPSSGQEIYTPHFLVSRVLDKLPKKVWCNPDLKWCDIAVKSGEFMSEIIIRLMCGLKHKIPNEKKRYNHIVKNMVYGYAVTVVGAMVSRKTVYGDSNINGNISNKYFTKDNKMKFDLIVGNPPFQEPLKKAAKGGSRGKDLWDKFLKKSLEDLNDGGYLAIIVPCMWRKPDAEMYPILKQYQVEYIEMHSAKRHANSNFREVGIDIFGVWTSFECIFLRKVPYTKATIVEDFLGKQHEINLMEWPWLPGAEFPCIKKILAKKNDEKCKIIHNESAYETRKEWMNQTKTKKFKYPCFHTNTKDGSINFWYSSRNDRGHFGIPKVIFSDGGYVIPYLDYKGEYGMCHHATGIPISSKKEGELLCKALKSDKFKKIVWATKWSGYETDEYMFTYFKKDFWKYFV